MTTPHEASRPGNCKIFFSKVPSTNTNEHAGPGVNDAFGGRCVGNIVRSHPFYHLNRTQHKGSVKALSTDPSISIFRQHLHVSRGVHTSTLENYSGASTHLVVTRNSIALKVGVPRTVWMRIATLVHNASNHTRIKIRKIKKEGGGGGKGLSKNMKRNELQYKQNRLRDRNVTTELCLHLLVSSVNKMRGNGTMM